MSKTIMILGAGTMQVPAIEAARRKGYRTVVADGNPDAEGAALADVFEHVDLKDKEGMLQAARRHREGAGLDGVFTAGTDFSATVAFVAENLGLPGIPHEVALNASDKARMRRCFRTAGVPHPRFAVVDARSVRIEGEDVAELSLPVVVKPVDNMGARGVVKVAAVNELPDVVGQAAAYSRAGRVIVEELIRGPEFSVDSIVTDGIVTATGVADRHIRFDPYFVEVGHTIPTALPPSDVDKIMRVFADGVHALGIVNGVAKGDVFMSPDGPVIGEIAARLSGGYMSGWTYPYSSGVDLTGAAIDQAVGLPPGPLAPSRSHTAAERALISCDGVVAGVLGAEKARAVLGVRDLFLRVQAGAKVRFPRNNVEKCANVIAAASSRQEATGAAESAVAALLVRLVPNIPETHAFLFSSAPPAYPCYPGLEESVRRQFDLSTRRLSEIVPGRPLSISPASAPALGGAVGWSYRSAGESVRLALAASGVGESIEPSAIDGFFWRAFARAGAQGGLYVLDSIGESPSLFRRRLQECA